MNFTRFSFRFAALSALIGSSTSLTFGQGDGWWRGIFKPKSDPIDVHAPATPVQTETPTDSTESGSDTKEPAAWPVTASGNHPSTAAAMDTLAVTSASETAIIELPPGAFVLEQPARLDSLDSLGRMNPPAVSGYRVQVFLGDLNAARAERAALRRLTDEPLYLQAMPPSYGLMVGDFHDKWAAERLRMQWSRLYPDALTIPTDINPLRLPEEKPESGVKRPEQINVPRTPTPPQD